MTRRPKSTKASRSANMEKAPDMLKEASEASESRWRAENALLAKAAEGGPFYGEPLVDPLKSPSHRRALREASRAAIRETVAKWLRMGADPEDVAFALEGQRVEVMAIGRARGKQG